MVVSLCGKLSILLVAFGGIEFVPLKDRSEGVQDIFWKAFGALSSVPGLKAFPVLELSFTYVR